VLIFSYTSSPQVKISQKVLGGLLFFDSHCMLFIMAYHHYHNIIECEFILYNLILLLSGSICFCFV